MLELSREDPPIFRSWRDFSREDVPALLLSHREAGRCDPNITISVLFVAGGWSGTHIASKAPRRRLTQPFDVVILAVTAYILFVNLSVLGWSMYPI